MSDNTPQWKKNQEALANIYNKSVEQGFYTDEHMRDVMSEEQAEKVKENRYRMGIEQEPDTGFWGELADETALAANRGFSNMLKFAGADRAAESLDRQLARNQQWLPPESRGVGGTVGAMIGSGIGSTAAVAPGMIAGAAAGALLGGPAGAAAGFAAPFMATFATQYNDVKQRNLDNGMDDNSATDAAIVETAALSAVETLLGTVPGIGKLLKGKPTAGLAARTIFKLNKKIGRNATTRFLSNLAKNAIGNGIEEGTEEAIQYLIGVAGESFSEYVGENKDFFEQLGKNFSASDMGYNTLAGLVAGTAMGTLPGAIDAGKTNARINRLARVFKLADENANNATATTPADTATASFAAANADTVDTAPVTAENITDAFLVARNDAEAEVIDRYDNMGEESLRSEAARSNLNIDAANADTELLRQILTSNALTQMRRDEVMQTAGVDYAPQSVPIPSAAETAPANTPVTAPGSIDRQSLVPEQQTIDVPQQTAGTAPQVPVETIATANTAPQVSAEVPQSVFAPAEPEEPAGNILSYIDNPVNITAPAQKENSEVRKRDIDAVAEYQEQIPGDEIFYSPSSNIADDNVRSAAALSQKIYRALDVGKVVNVVTESGNGVFNGASRVVPRRNLVNLDHARTPLQYLHAAMHELVHSLIKRNAENYKKFAEKILPLVMGEEQFQRKLNKYISERAELGIKITKEGAVEEFVCDMIADLMQTRHFWEVLSKEDLPLALKLYKAVTDFIKRIEGILDTNSELEAIFKKNLAEVERIAAEFIFADNAQTTQVNTQATAQEVSAKNAQTTQVASNKQDVASPVASSEQVSSQAEVVSAENAPATETDTAAVKENLTTENTPTPKENLEVATAEKAVSETERATPVVKQNLTTEKDTTENKMKNTSSANQTKSIDRYNEYLDNQIAKGVLKLNEVQRKVLVDFYKDFPLGKIITSKLGEQIRLEPKKGESVESYIHHFAVKRGKNSAGKYWENFSTTHLNLFSEIAQTIENFEQRILGAVDIKNENNEVVDVASRIYFIRNIGNNHLVTVAVEPKTMLLTWTHMTPKDNYIEKIKNSEKESFDKFGVVDKNGNRQKITWDEYQNVKEDMPLYLATAQGSQNSLPQAANSASNDTIPQSSEKSSVFTEKDGSSLQNDSGETVLVYREKAPKGAIWGDKKFKSDNIYGTANYAIVGDDVHIRMTNNTKTGKRYLFFTIPDFRNKTISEVQQAVQTINDETYPLGRNFDDLLNSLHDHGMRVYPSGLKPLAGTRSAENKTATPDEAKISAYESRFGNVINTDNAKLLFKDDGYNPHDAESVKKFHVKAGEIVRNLFNRFLKERKGKGNGFVVFTAGGNGSGKSSVMIGDLVKNADFVFDSAMVNYEAARKSIQQVIDNGQTPLLAFVYRNPADAWFNGVQKRNKSADGHIVPDSVFANTHAIARDTFLKLVDEFDNKVQYIIKEVADGKASEISIEELKNKPKYTTEQIKEAVNAETYNRAKEILKGFETGRIQRSDNQGNSADGRSTGRGSRTVSSEQQREVTSAESTISKITSSPVGSNTRIMAFADLPDGEHTVNGKTFTKKGNAFTLDGKTLNAREIEKATRTLNEKFRAKPKDEAAEPQAKAEKIEDFGEKIGGARKDIIRQYADKINLDGKTFAKMFPKPDYAKLLEAGIKIDVLAKLKTAYDMAKNEVKKHRTMDGRQNLTVAKFFAAYAKAALIGEDSIEFRDGNWGFTEHGKRTITVRSQAMEQLLKELGVEYADVDLKGFDITDTWENGVKPEKPRWVVSSKDDESWQKRYRVWAVYGKTGFFDKLDEAIKYFIELVKKHTTLEQPKYKIKIYRSISGEHAGEYYITAAIRGFGDVPLQYFKTGKEARAYYYDHANDLQHQAAETEEQKKAERKGKLTGKNKPLRLRFNAETLRDRVGIDYRKGKNISAKEFVEMFGFRAVEFGNSVSQKERQIALNALYDSLLDLANTLGISPKAISLNGKLAFAYGARGTGNAEAHYEPERNVINLTKTRGAGNIAHEWWHALDHYFSDNIKYTATSGTYRKDIRSEVKEAFEKLRSYLDNNSKYVVRSERLDAFTKKDYYSVPTELMARAFTDYVSRQLESQGQINDFLSNQVSEADWKGEAETYPYPTGDDAVKIGELLQNLFNTLDEKTDSEGNTIVFSIAGEKGANRMANAETLLDNLRIAKEMESAGKDAKEIKLATGWEKGGDGKWRMEIPDLKISDTALDRSLNYMAGEAGELLDAPELFEAYPELRNINIITVMEHENKLPENVGGRYDEERKTIFVNAKATELARYEKQILKTAREDIEESWNLSKEELEMRKELEIETDPEKIRKNAYKRIAKLEAIQKEKFQDIIIHEIQHAIQKIEGFARGGSINAETKLSLESTHKARANALRKHLADAGFDVSSDEAMLLTDEKADDVKLGKLWDKLVDNGMTEEKYNEIYSRIPLFIGYHNLAGEVESRNADRRSRMTMEERRQSLLDETADVAPEDRIYLMEEAGVSEQSALKRKPRNIKDFLNMEGHTRPERLDINENTPTGELFDIFKKYILDRDDIITPEGYKLKAKEGHFYSFCCGKTDKPKGFIEKAANAKEALEMVKNSQVKQSDMAGFQLNRIRNIKTYIDVITDPDFSYRVGDKVVYGKKYDDIKNANGFTSVALDLHNNTLSPIHSGFEVFTEEKLENHDIKWYAELDVDTPLDSALTTGSIASREQLPDRFDKNITRSGQNVNPQSAKNAKKIAFSVVRPSGITPEVQKLLDEQKPVVTPDWVKENRAVYEALYKYVFPSAREISETPSKRETEILNTVLSDGTMSQSEMVAEPYYNDADAKLKEKTDNAVSDAIDDASEKIVAHQETFLEKQKRFWHDKNAKRDLPLWELALRTPIWIAEKLKDVPVVKSIYQAVQTMVDDKQRIYDHLSGNVIKILNDLAKKDREMYKKLSGYLFAADRDQTGAGKIKKDSKKGKFIALTADNEKIGEYDTEAEAWDALFRKEREQLIAEGYSTAAGDALYEIRTANYRTFTFMMNNTLRQLRLAGLIDAKSTSFIVTDASQFFPELEADEKVGDVDLFAMMREMGNRSGYYMPRKRKPGQYLLFVSKKGEPSRLETFDSKISRSIAANKYSRKGYHTESLLSKSASQDALNQVNPAALMDIINQAASRAKDFIKGNITFAMKDYTRKDGVVEKNLVVSGKGIDKALHNLLKEMGGKFWDSDKSWHFINPDAGLQSKLSDIIENKVSNDMKLAALMQTTLFESIRDMIRENSSSSFKLARRNAKGDAVVRGYIEDPIHALALYYSGIAGGTARNVMAKKMYSAYGGMDFDREKFIADHIPADITPDSDKYPRAKLEAIAEYYKEVKRRAIDSSRQPNIAKYMDKYIKDMLRNTDSVERIVGTMKGWAAIYMLGKIPSAVNNMFSAGMVAPAVISRFTNENTLKAAIEFGKGIGLYWKYWAYNKFGNGKNLKGIDKTLFDIIHKNHWDGSEFAEEAFAANAGYLDKVTQFSAKYGLLMFGMVEQANRAATIRAAAIAIAKKKGVDLAKLSALELKDIMLEAKEISDKANGVYNKSNKQSFVRGGGLHAIADGLMLFQQYAINLFQIYADLFKNHRYGSLAYMTAATGLIAGVSGDIALRVIASALGAVGVSDGDDDKDYDEQFYGFIGEKSGKRIENLFRFGLPSQIDVNLSATYQNILTGMHERKSLKPELFSSVPPAVFFWERLTNAYDYSTTGQWWKASETLLPAVAASASRGVRESIYGITDRSDRIRKDINDEEIRPDAWASAARVLGFNPVSISEKTEALWNEKKIRARYADKRKELYTRLRDWSNSASKDSAELAQITADIDEYNARANRSKRRIPLIDEKSIERALESKNNKFFKEDDED